MKLSFKNIASVIAIKASLLSGVSMASDFSQEDHELEWALKESLKIQQPQQSQQPEQMQTNEMTEEEQLAFCLQESMDLENKNPLNLRLIMNLEKKKLNDLKILATQNGKSLRQFAEEENNKSRQNLENLSIEENASMLGMTIEDYKASIDDNKNRFKDSSVDDQAHSFKTDMSFSKSYGNNNQKLHNISLKFQETSGENNNCLLHSIIGNDSNLLTRIIGARQLAEDILALPEEVSDINAPYRRNLDFVRVKFLEDISKSLDAPFEKANNRTEFTSFRSVIEDIRNEALDQTYFGLTTEEYLDKKAADQTFLNIGFADIFSQLYGKSVYVFTPQYDIDKSKLSLANANYLKISDKADPVFVLHRGSGHAHYSRLVKSN